MKFSPIPFSDLQPDSFLSNYTKGDSTLEPFYSFYPFASNRLKDISNDKINSLQSTFTSSRAEIVEALKDLHQSLGIDESQTTIRTKLLHEDSYCVVTGQQLSWYGGPLYTYFKLMSAIQWSKRISKELGKTVIPVFWLADEDHDYAEINQINWYQSSNDSGYFEYESLVRQFQADVRQELLKPQVGMPVSQIKGDSPLIANEFFEWLSSQYFNEQATSEKAEEKFDSKAVKPSAQFRKNTWVESFLQEFREAYSEDKTHAQNFSQWIAHVFKGYDFLIAGSNHRSIKRLLSPIIQKAVTNDYSITELLKNQTASVIEKTGQSQVTVMDSQWFVFTEDAKRVKLYRDSTNLFSYQQKGASKTLTQDELQKLTQLHPEWFSPNVFLRPILQDHLLPVIAYVGGPAEIAYHGQMKKMYEFFDMDMPILIPRFSGTIREKKVHRLMEKFPFSLAHYQASTSMLKNNWLASLPEQFPDAKIDELELNILQRYRSQARDILSFDPSLEGSIGKTENDIHKAIQSLKKKAKQAHESKFERELGQLHFLQSYLFPKGPMERVLHPTYFMLHYGKNFWQDLLRELLDYETDISQHYIIDL